jgi:Fe-S-cluster containining protein
VALLHFDPEQRFACKGCARCCRRGWEIALTPAEVESYRRGNAGRWFREREDVPEGPTADPFEPIPGQAPHARIRKRPDGVCGFLSPENRCRIHEELGGDRKPLTCRLFPFQVHPAGGPPVVVASFSCPTVVANEGATLGSQARELSTLRKDWARAYPEAEGPLDFVEGHPLAGGTLGTLRTILRQMLDRPGPNGVPELRANVARMAHLLDDLTRWRVLRLAPDAFAEYVELVGRHAARSEKPLPVRAPSRLSRFLSRGFLYAVVAARIQTEGRRGWGMRLRLTLLLLHFHGIWPQVPEADLGAARRLRAHPDDPSLAPLVRNYLRVTIETLGTGRRPVVDEFTLAVALLDAALDLASMGAVRAGASAVSVDHFTQGLVQAADLTHAVPRGAFASFLGTLSGGVEALYRFAADR